MLYMFDCDGVLVDSEIIASEVDAEHLTRLGYPITAAEVTQRFAGLTAVELGRMVESETGRPLPDDFYIEQKAEIDRRLARDLEPVAGILALTEKLDGALRCVCSNSSGQRLKMELEKTRLYDFFAPHIFSAGEVGNKEPKPSPNVYLHAMSHFGVPPREAVVIEDSVFGVMAAKLSGARVVGFTGGRHTWPGHADKLTDAGAETVINRMADLPAVAAAFKEWGGLVD
jgi:HAD superfamily hydrolase (TIGR01509 family)